MSYSFSIKYLDVTQRTFCCKKDVSVLQLEEEKNSTIEKISEIIMYTNRYVFIMKMHFLFRLFMICCGRLPKKIISKEATVVFDLSKYFRKAGRKPSLEIKQFQSYFP